MVEPDLGGRPARTQPLDAVDWENLNAGGLSLGQFTSIATNPSFPARRAIWGGTQDNGTLRKSATSNTWFDMTSGDGGQVLVDPTDSNYVYGTYFGISPYRITDGGDAFFTNQIIASGIDPTTAPSSTCRSCSTSATRISCSRARTGSIAPTTRKRRRPAT